MVGIVIVTHCSIAQGFVEAAESIFSSRIEALEAVSIDINENVEISRERIENSINKVKRNSGVLIMTDMYGGTPSNLSFSFLAEGRVEVIAGVNLSVLIKAVSWRNDKSLAELSEALLEYGKKSITLASAVLKGNKRN